MKIYDTLSASHIELERVETFDFYNCGPTVYNYIHIGNARPIIVADIFVRYLEYKNQKVNYLLNITDIDDKIINKAIEENVKETEIANRYTEAFIKNLEQLNVRMPNKIIPISEKVNEIIDFIDVLEQKGFAYEIEGNVYFDVEKIKDQYGVISKQNLDELIEASRVEKDNNKKSASDFLLWKNTDLGKKFLTKWCLGRPGWHTECAVLIRQYFGGTINAHMGGVDLRFPHHENERIQYLARYNEELSKRWMHCGHINIDGEKMSKSIGNVMLLNDFLEKYDHNVLRYMFINTRYTQPINLSDDLFSQAEKFVEKINLMITKLNWMKKINSIQFSNEVPIDEDFNSLNYMERFTQYMDDDLNTAMVVSLMEEMLKGINKQIPTGIIDKTYEKLLSMLKVLGFKFTPVEITDEDCTLLKQWQNYLLEKNYDKADELRDVLQEKGII